MVLIRKGNSIYNSAYITEFYEEGEQLVVYLSGGKVLRCSGVSAELLVNHLLSPGGILNLDTQEVESISDK